MPAAVLIALMLLIVAAPPAEATFPGRNGDLLATESGGGRYPDESPYLLRVDPRSGAVAQSTICQEPPSSLPQPRCFGAGPPAASADGASLAFVAEDVSDILSDGGASLRVLTLATGQWSHIPLPATVLPFTAVARWTPDGALAVLVDHGRALLVRRDGSEPEPLISHVSALDVSIGGQLAFVRGRALRVREPDGATQRLTGRGASRPSWSPHGKSVAFTYKGWVYTVSSAGGRPRRLTRGFNPVWSPDGKLIAFFRADPKREYFGDDATYLYVLNRRTGRVRRVSSRLMALEEVNSSATAGLDWQVAR